MPPKDASLRQGVTIQGKGRVTLWPAHGYSTCRQVSSPIPSLWVHHVLYTLSQTISKDG